MCKRYKVKERSIMVTLAKKLGVKSTAKTLNINIKTVYLWLNRYNRGLPLIGKTDTSLTDNDITSIIKTAKELPELTLTKRRKLIDNKCSLSTIHRILIKAEIHIKVNRLLKYHCIRCFGVFRAISVYYGIPRKPACPNCGQILRIVSSQSLPFYYPRREDLLIRGAKLELITSGLLVDIEALLDIPKAGIPLFIQIIPRSCFPKVHIIKNYQENQPHSFCGRSKCFNSNINIFSMVTRRIRAKDLCNICMDRSIEKYNLNKDLSPKFETNRKTNKQRKLKLLIDTTILKNVSLACKINGFSRPTYYSARREFGELI